MKIMLVRPKPHKNSLGLADLMTCEPIEMEYVAALCKRLGHDVVLEDMILEKKSLDTLVKEFGPDVVMFTSYITHVNVIKHYSDLVKGVDARIVTVVGGVHSEVLPDDFKYKNIDYVVGVNGMQNTEILLNALEKNEKPCFKHGEIDKTYRLPMPDREISRRYRKHYDYAYHVPCALLKSSFGCPYNCKFCFCVQITQNQYYERELEQVIDELKLIEEPNVFIVDDNFLVNRNRIITFCKLLDENKIDKKFIIFGRADFIVKNPDMIELLSQHGLDAVFVGIESFKQSDLNDFNKRTDVETGEKASDILYKYNVDLYAGAIVGPDWDKKDFRNFAKWIRRMHIRYVNLQPLVPLPATPIYDVYKDQLLLKREEYEKWDLTHLAILPTKLTPSQYYFEIIRGYFRTTASFSSLRYIRKKCGVKVEIKCFRGAMKMLWHYVKMMWEYRKVGKYEK
ncbi:MAG: cobalamin-dependent protein [Fibrobacter sp.]|uniref:B12-binding domain-containing radical SAM protein n=1 Tax=Fibrobacter sp. TaxID=35828 RepID=UPI0025BE65E2|nr:radical SAM protein [Fibrobacter sp.]MBR4784411.1 cobalamin-dependent protein [Fibrobacter sp.]